MEAAKAHGLTLGNYKEQDYVPGTILLTGGAGFIGSNVLVYLMRKYPSYRVICLDVLDVCATVNNFKEVRHLKNFTFIQGDIRSKDLLRHILSHYNVDTVMHFAAQTHVDNSFGSSISFTEANVVGTHVLLESVRSVGKQVRRFVHVSTDEVYGEVAADGERCTEKSELNPSNPYAATKVSAEYLVKSYAQSFKMPTIITRSNNVYGPKQYPEKLIPKFTSLLARGQSCPLHGDGTNRRSYLYVEDVARAFDVILHKGEIGQIYNVASEQELENREVLTKLVGIYKSLGRLPADYDAKAATVFVRNRAFNDFRYHIDSSSLVKLGWTKKYPDFDEGLKLTVDWYLANQGHWGNVDHALLAHPVQHSGLTQEELKENETRSVPFSNGSPLATPRNGVFQFPNAVAPRAVAGPLRWLVYGHGGWIGGQVLEHLHARSGDTVLLAKARADDEAAVDAEMAATKPDRVLSLIGRTYGPGCSTIDYLEQKGKLSINVRDNLFAPVVLRMMCAKHQIHYTYLGTGCIFSYDEQHKIGGKGFTEADKPNFHGSSYSVVKGFTDRLMHMFEQSSTEGAGVLNCRIRMPIEGRGNSRDFITKITTYAKICSIENSMTVLPELLPVMLDMAAAEVNGTVNLTNPGAITHNRILEMYKELVDPKFTWANFTEEEQAQILAAARSNNLLETSVLQQFKPDVRPIEQAVREVLMQMAQSKK